MIVMVVSDDGRVMLSAQCGWVRIFCDEDDTPGTLVYLTNNTCVRDVCRDLVLADHHTIWLQFGGGEGRRLNSSETPLSIQDDFLQKIGYDDTSRRARLGIDPDLRHIIRFYIGPSSREAVDRSGSVFVLKGLVLPQWKRRTIALLANKMFIYPGAGSAASMEEIDLKGAAIEASRNTRCGRRVLRISGSKQLFLGFEENWERSLWWSWISQASESESSTERLDLSGAGIENLPEATLKCWPDVENLILSRNRLTGDLKLLSNLRKLRNLALADNGWTTLPPGITSLSNLKYLDLSDNNLTFLPDDFTKLSGLEELRLDRNGLKSLPGRQGAYPRLQCLSISHNKLSNLPVFLDANPAMRELTLLDVGESRKENEAALGEELRSVNLRANLLKGSIVLGNYGLLVKLATSAYKTNMAKTS